MPFPLLRLSAWLRRRAPGLQLRTGGARHPAYEEAEACLEDQDRRVLVIDDLIPDPLFGAGYPRAHAVLLSLMRAGFQVSMYPMSSSRSDRPRMRELFDGRVSLRSGRGRSGLRRLLARDGDSFDVIFISRPSPMRAFVEARGGLTAALKQPAVIYDAEAVLTPREALRRELAGNPWTRAETAAALVSELEAACLADVVTAVSPSEAALIASTIAAPALVLSHSVQLLPAGNGFGFGDRQNFCFVGRLTGDASTSPNLDSLLWFLKAVMPLLDTMIGSKYKVNVAGLIDAKSRRALCDERFVLHGMVDDLTGLYSQSRVFIAPTRFAAGIPLKVIEAMANGLPCALTPILVRQLDFEGEIARSPNTSPEEAFARACARLYSEEKAWTENRDRGVTFVGRRFSEAAFDLSVADAVRSAFEQRSS